jgi:SAM-dependent methyltransferase
MPSHFRRSTCRLCDFGQLELVVPLTPTPLADDYVPASRLNATQECYPLDLYQCLSCGHVQLLDVVDPEALFRKYSYFSGRSPALAKHFEEYAEDVLAAAGLPDRSLIVDIGSNDGCFLEQFGRRGMRVLGIDPAENVAAQANARGIETLPAFFDAAVAERIQQDYGPAQIVSANNVYAHTDDLAGMTDAVRRLLADDGVFVFEVSYLLDVVDHLLVGSIFHEHLCYHAVAPLEQFLARHGLELIDVRRVGIQGGSLIGTAQKIGGERPVTAAVGELKSLEARRNLSRPETIRSFSHRLNALAASTHETIRKLSDAGKSIAGFGASRGGTLILYHFQLGELLPFLVDDSPDKQGLYSPGYHIPVLPTAALYDRKPDYAIILAWVHTQSILAKHRAYMDQGGHFVSCYPRVEITP